jgi:DAHP synthetase I family
MSVIVDPSHASGDRRLVGRRSGAAAAAGANGLIVEVDRDPEAAVCDGPRAPYASVFDLRARRGVVRGVARQAPLLGGGRGDALGRGLRRGAGRQVAQRQQRADRCGGDRHE